MPASKRKKSNTDRSQRVLGVMSGSSLDGLDLALCTLGKKSGRWSFKIESAKTVQYPARLRTRLLEVMHGSALDLARLDVELGAFIGRGCKSFIGKRVDLIASHGHTIFHIAAEGLTTQIGSGAVIAAITGIPTVCDFRTKDMALDGQGAPLVPLGEQLLFPDHKAFVNLGGICNISLHTTKRVIGYDVCIGNQALNFLAAEAGKPFDKSGAIAASGAINAPLLARLNALPFHAQKPPRSLGREWFNEQVQPLINDRRIPMPDRMRTVVEHVAQQLGSALKNTRSPVLVTGGGAHNSFLMDRIRANTRADVQVPHRTIVDYKEALVFGLLGLLRMNNEVNTLASVTGAKRDSVGGAIYPAN